MFENIMQKKKTLNTMLFMCFSSVGVMSRACFTKRPTPMSTKIGMTALTATMKLLNMKRPPDVANHTVLLCHAGGRSFL